VSEALDLKPADFKPSNKLLLRTKKGGKIREILLEDNIFNSLKDIIFNYSFIYHFITYTRLLKFLKRNFKKLKYIKTEKNTSRFHTLRKLYIRNKFYDPTVDKKEFIKDMGWKNQSSILYYL